MAVTELDGRAFEKFVAAGTYFLRKYRGVLNDLNVFPVPDGDTGSNMYLTLRSAVEDAAKASAAPRLSDEARQGLEAVDWSARPAPQDALALALRALGR